MAHDKPDSTCGAFDAVAWPDAQVDGQTANTDPVSQPPPPEVYSLRQVARMFGRTERTINNWVRSGHLQRGGFGKAVFFSRAAIDALLNGQGHSVLPLEPEFSLPARLVASCGTVFTGRNPGLPG